MPKVIEVAVFAIYDAAYGKVVYVSLTPLCQTSLVSGERLIPAVLTLDLEKKA